MVFFLNSKVKTHTEDALQYIFDENKEKIVILGYSIVSRRSPLTVSALGFFFFAMFFGIIGVVWYAVKQI